MLLAFFLLLSFESRADVFCYPVPVDSQSSQRLNVECLTTPPAQGFIDQSTTPTSIILKSIVNGQRTEQSWNSPRCNGVPCTLEMLRTPERYPEFRSQFPSGATATDTEISFLNLNPETPLYRNERARTTGYTVSAPFSFKVPYQIIRGPRSGEIVWEESNPNDPALTGREARGADGRRARLSDFTDQVPTRSTAQAAPVAPAAPEVVVATDAATSEEPASPYQASDCKYRDRTINGRDDPAPPGVTQIPGCAQKICVASAVCTMKGPELPARGIRARVSLYCNALGDGNCPDATACANGESLQTFEPTLDERTFRNPVTPGAGRR